jgi:hypothetical protein
MGRMSVKQVSEVALSGIELTADDSASHFVEGRSGFRIILPSER